MASVCLLPWPLVLILDLEIGLELEFYSPCDCDSDCNCSCSVSLLLVIDLVVHFSGKRKGVSETGHDEECLTRCLRASVQHLLPTAL